jgi:hypothetical protein
MIDEVVEELVADGVVPAESVTVKWRSKLAQKLLTLAGLWWTDTQIKQLLLRAFRNRAKSHSVEQHTALNGKPDLARPSS